MWPKNLRDLSRFLGYGVNSDAVRSAIRACEARGYRFERKRHGKGHQYRIFAADINPIREQLRCMTYHPIPSQISGFALNDNGVTDRTTISSVPYIGTDERSEMSSKALARQPTVTLRLT